MSETYETCTKDLSEACLRHPVDCPNCANDPGCRQSEIMLAHPDKIKSCPAFRPRKEGLL